MSNKGQQNFFTILIAAVATFVLGPIAFTWMGATTTLSTFASFAVRAAVGLIANALQPDPPKRVQGYRVTQRGTAIDHQVVYGKARVAGTIVFDKTTGTNNKYLHRVIAFTGHEIESFDKLYINGLEVETLAGDGNVTSIIDENGSSSGRYNGYIRIKKHFGADSQTADADLVSEVAEWTTNHRLRGISYLYVRMMFKQEVYPNGIPEITADIKGKKVYNPATTLTAWSDNPALCVRDYLTSSYGLNDISANIDDTLVTTAANACNRTASNADTWFTMNGAFNTSAVPADILNTLLSTMGGTLWFSQGKWRMRAAIWEAPTLTLDEDDLRGPLSVNTRHSRRDNFNVIKGTFSGPETQWFPSDYPEYKVAQAITDDGGIESVVDLNLPFTDNAAECQRVARIVYERNRQQLTVKGNFGLRAFDLQVGDVVRLDNARLGFDDLNIKYFEVVDWNFAASVGEIIVSLTLRETSSSVFDEIDSYATFELDNTSLSSPFDVQTVTYGNPQTSAPINRDGTAIPEILFTWSVDNTDEVDYFIFSYKKSGDSVYTSINVSDTYYRLSAVISGVTYDYAIQAVNHKGVRSPFSASTVSTANDSVAPAAPTALTANGGYKNIVLNWINPTDYDLAYVEVYRVEGSDVFIGAVSGTSFVDGGRADETSYTYKLKAVDFSGNKSAFTATQSAQTLAGTAGTPGADGYNVAVVTLYNKNTSSVTPPSTFSGTFTYTFSTGALTGGTPNGWTQTAPSISNGEYLWVRQATATAQTATDTIASAEFSAGSVVGVGGVDGTNGTNGTNGAAGLNNATVFLYHKNTSSVTPPAAFTGTATYTFSTGAITGLTLNGWSQTPPTLSQGEYLWFRLATASSNTTTDTIAIGEWATAAVQGGVGTDGATGATGSAGADGYNAAVVTIFNKNTSSVTPPSNPSGTFTYTFSTGALTGGTPNGWATTAPSLSQGDYLWAKQATAYSQGTTDSVTAAEFGSATVVGIGGTDGATGATGATGAAGLNSAPVFLYRKNTSSVTPPSAFSGTFTYTFSTKVLSGGTLNGWTTTPPSLVQGEYLWFRQATASSASATDTIPTSEFSAAAVLSGAGSDGATGSTGATGARGAGWWRYEDTVNASTYYDTDTQNRVNAAFSTAVGLAIVEGDRFIISCTDDTAIAFIYSSGSWVSQDAFVDGNLLVDGTITGQKVAAATIESDKMNVGSLSAITATMGQLDVTDYIRIDTEGAAFLAGRDGASDISQDGFYIGREEFNGTLGFEVSHISEDENGDISGIVHNNNGFKVYNPKLMTGGSFNSTNVYLYTNGTSHNLGSGLTSVTFTAIGGGGGGGNSWNNYSSAEKLSEASADVYFDSLTGWTTAAGTPAINASYLEIQNAEIRRSFTTISGRSYVLMMDHFTGSSNITIKIGTTDGGSEIASYDFSNSSYQTEIRRGFVSTASTLYLSIDDNSTTGQKTTMDTIHVHETNYHGGDTTVKVWAGSVGGTLIATKTSLGGPGGRTALPAAWGGTINSEAGQSSTWGVGGPAVSRNTDGANATGYSAGGGGAGGDDYDIFDNKLGYAGKGGRKGSETTFVVDTSAYVGSDIIIEADVVGAGGAVGTLHTWQGGSGAPGFVIVQSPIGQTIEYEIGNLVPKFTPIATQTLAASAIAATYTWTGLSAYEIISVEYNMSLDVASSVTIQARQAGGTWRTLRTQSTASAASTTYMKFDIMYFNSTHRKAFYVLSDEVPGNDFSGSTGGAAVEERYMPWNSTGTNEAFSEIRVTHPLLDVINGDTWNSYIRISGARKANGQFPWSID